MLYSYSTLNHTAIYEILKIYEELRINGKLNVEGEELGGTVSPGGSSTSMSSVLSSSSHIEHHYANLNAQPFYTSLNHVTDMTSRTERLFCKTFNMSADKAKAVLNRPNKKLSQQAIFGLGLWCGVNMSLIAVLILLFVWSSSEFDARTFFAAFPIYRGILMILLMIWCYGIMTFLFQKFRINYVFILNLDPPTALGHFQIFKMAALLTCVWLSSFVLFTIDTKTGYSLLGIEDRYYPLGMLVAFTVLLINPIHVFYRTTRTWLGQILWQCLLSPFSEVMFVHSFIADILTSMPKFFSDLEYIICYYVTGDWLYSEGGRCQSWVHFLLPFTGAFPLWLRFWQCIRRLYYTNDKEHAANAGKYFSSLSVFVFGAMNNFQVYSPVWQAARVFWFISFVVATIYLYYWDITMDWGLGRLKRKSHNLFLRNNLIFKPIVYYVIITLDGIGRFCWTWALSQYPIPGLSSVYTILVFASIEILRRSMWGVIRIENEHLNNCIKYRALRDVSLPSEKEGLVKDL